MIDHPTAKRIATLLHALGESNRLLLLDILIGGESCVKDLAAGIRKNVVNVSHHLSVLRNAGLVGYDRRGRHRYYAVAADVFRDSIPGALGAFQIDGCRVLIVGPNPPPAAKKKPPAKKRK